MKEKIIAALKALGLYKEEDAAKISAELDKLETAPAKVDTSKIVDEGLKAVVESLQNNVQILTQQNKELLASIANEKTIREKATQLQQDQLKADKEKKVAAAVQKLLDEGKISSDEEKALWKKTFESDLETGEKLSAALPVKPGFKSNKNQQQQNNQQQNNQNNEKKTEQKSSLLNVNKSIYDKIAEYSPIQE